MAKPSSIDGGILLLLIASTSLFSILTNSLPLHSAMAAAAADFEGFDADDLDVDSYELETLTLSNPNPTTLIDPSLIPETPSPPSDPVSDPSPVVEIWDADEFEGIPAVDPIPVPDPMAEIPSSPTSKEVAAPISIRSFAIEIICIIFIIAFATNYFVGRRQNERIALAWAGRYAGPGSVLDKNFTVLSAGNGSPLLLKEGLDVFKFYASGRKFCHGIIGTIELKSRQDLIMRFVDLVLQRKDMVTFEVVMNEEAMDHVVVAVARRKMAKAMHKECRDLARFSNLMGNGMAGRKWVAEELMVVTESKEVAGDVINEAVLDQVFGEKAFEKFGKWFISLHFSDQQPGTRKKILYFKFAMPGVSDMEDMARLVALVPYYVDLIGRYKLSSQVRFKTEAARIKAAQEADKELRNARQEELQRRKAEKKKILEEAESKLSAEIIRRREETERARQLKKSGAKIKKLR